MKSGQSRSFVFIFIAAFVCILLAGYLPAQTATGALRGRVTDPTGAVIPQGSRGNLNDDAGSRPYIKRDFRGEPFGKGKDELLDARQEVLTQPLDDITVWRQQFEFAVPLHGLQGSHPGVELLFRELALEYSQTAVP